MKENEAMFVVLTDTGKIYDEEDRNVRYATMAELLDRIKYCEHELNILAGFYGMDKELTTALPIIELENIIYFSGEIQLCWNLINEGKYLEVNRYAID